MARIGTSRRRVRFEKRARGGNYAGVVNQDFALLCGPVWARIEPLRGGETVQAGLIEGKETFRLRVRSSTATRLITTGCRAVEHHNPDQLYNIMAIQNPDERNRELYLICTRVAAAG
jgi:head-tail adaptor